MILTAYLRSKFLFPLAERLSGRQVSARADWLRTEFKNTWQQRQLSNRYRLVEVLQNAQHEIPYYRDLFRKVKFDPLKVLKDERYFEHLPILTKEDLREAGDRILHPQCKKYMPIHISRTNGSTGSALPIYYTTTSKDYSAAVTRISQDWVGFGPDKLQMHISSALPEATPKAAIRQEWWRQQATNRLSVECDAWSDEGLLALWHKVEKSGAYLLQGHPSTMYALARFVKNHFGIKRGAFQVFVSTGETLTDQQRELIEEVFACHVANRYGNAEFGIIAHEHFANLNTHSQSELHELISPLEASELHYMQVMDPYVWVESLSAAKGDRSSILVTDLTNFSSPLIRYATGDEGQLIKGSESIYLTPVTGRVHDQIQLNGTSYPTHWFQDMFTRMGNVDDFQFVHSTGKPIELRICLVDPAGENAMRGKLIEWLGAETFNLKFVKRHDFIRVGQQQKFRYLVDLDQPKTTESPAAFITKNLFVGSLRNRPYLHLTGWNTEEVYGDISFRWMCKCGVIALNPKIAAQELAIEYDYPADAPVLPRLTINCSGEKLHEEMIQPGYHTLTLQLPEDLKSKNKIELELSSLYPVAGDSRELGLKIHSVKFS